LRLILIPCELGQPPVDPRQPDFAPDKYTAELMRPLYMYVLAGSQLDPESTKLAREFLDYVRGVRGQEILEDHNFYTHFDPPAYVELALLPDFQPDPIGLPIVCLYVPGHTPDPQRRLKQALVKKDQARLSLVYV
jgi:hypothetical protein